MTPYDASDLKFCVNESVMSTHGRTVKTFKADIFSKIWNALQTKNSADFISTSLRE